MSGPRTTPPPSPPSIDYMLMYEDLAFARVAELQAEAERDRLARRLPRQNPFTLGILLARLASAWAAIAAWRRLPARKVHPAG